MSEYLETIGDYYQRLGSDQNNMFTKTDFEIGQSHFNISMRKYCSFKSPYNRRDYYKISLIIGKGKLQYGNEVIMIDRPALFLPSPNIPYKWTCESDNQEGYFCLFNQEFFRGNQEFSIFKKTSLFKDWGSPFIFLNEEQKQLILTYFEQIYKLNQSNYVYKCNSIKSHLAAILHLALETKSDDVNLTNLPANIRLYRLFDELLNQQFPLDSPAYPLELKTASDYAESLNVHVNHLNSSVKSISQRTTTQLIKEKIFEESKNLLTYTNWDIAEVGYTLGFDQPAHFNNFFKKQAQISPLKFRQNKIKIL